MVMEKLHMNTRDAGVLDSLTSEAAGLEDDLTDMIEVFARASQDDDLTFLKVIEKKYRMLLEEVCRFRHMAASHAENRGSGEHGRQSEIV